MRAYLASVGSVVKRNIYLIIAILVIIVGFCFYWFHVRRPKAPISPPEISLTPVQKINAQSKYAQTNLNNKDYAAAVVAYQGAAADAYGSGKFQQSAALLQQCIANVPSQYITWDVYYALFAAAQQLKEVSLEKSSLQSAINIASVPGSGVSSDDINKMKKLLTQL